MRKRAGCVRYGYLPPLLLLPLCRPLPLLALAVIGGILHSGCPPAQLAIFGFLYFLLSLFFLALGFGSRSRRMFSLLSYLMLLLPLTFLAGYLRAEAVRGSICAEAAQTIDGAVTISGQVETISGRSSGDVLVLTAPALAGEPTVRQGRLLVYLPEAVQVEAGDSITVSGRLRSLTPAENPAQFDAYAYYTAQHITATLFAEQIQSRTQDGGGILRALSRLKRLVAARCQQLLPERAAGVVCALLLGERSLLAEDLEQLYRESGIGHILAISGLHVSLLGLSLYKLLRKVHLPVVGAGAAAVFVIFCYGVMTGMGISTVRAVLMLSLYILAQISGKTYDALSALSVSAIFILLRQPLQLFQASFLLSFGAILGICLFSSIPRLTRGAAGTLLTGVYLYAALLPLQLYFFYETCPYAPLLNLLVLPLLSVLVLCAVLAVLTVGLLPLLGRFFCGSVYYILELYELLCTVVKRFRWYLLPAGRPTLLQIAAYYVLFCLIAAVLHAAAKRKKSVRETPLQRRKRKQFGLAFSVCALPPLLIAAFLLFRKTPDGLLTATFLSVGQGDCAVIRTPDGQTLLVDCGSASVSQVGTYRLVPFLKANGIHTIDAVFVSHADEDHVNGIYELLNALDTVPDGAQQPLDAGQYKGAIRLKRLVVAQLAQPDTAHTALLALANKKGLPVTELSRGDLLVADEGRLEQRLETPLVHNETISAMPASENAFASALSAECLLTCLYPAAETAQQENRNDTSLLLNCSYGSFSLLLTGDLTAVGEYAYLKTQPSSVAAAGTYTLLKVAHHGSNTSSTAAFLASAQPRHAVISCGRGNTYGHPHPAVLERLEAVGCEPLVLWKTGAVTIQTDGRQVWKKQFLTVPQNP